MKILVTGSGGMVGRNIVEFGPFSQYEILAPRRSELDLTSYKAVEDYLKRTTPDLIVHCAGKVGGIQANMRSPVEFLLENFDIGRNIVMAAHNQKIRRFINMGSSCMYPRDCTNPIVEEMVLRGQLEPTNEGYALSKVVVARLCEYISRQNPDFQYKTLIPCNLYGRYDKFDPENSHMVPGVMRRLEEAKTRGQESVEIWGDGTARREFMYVEDLADFLFNAVQNFDRLPATLNVGLGYDYSINDYYQLIAKTVGYEGLFTHDLSRPIGMKQKLVSVTKLNEFGWKAPTSLETGLQKTYSYMKSHLKI